MSSEENKQTTEKEEQSTQIEANEETSEQETPLNAEEQEEIGTDEASETDKPVEETKDANAELAEMKDKYLRLYSDFENFRRRTAKEKVDFLKTANEGLLKELLPVLDDFARANASLGETPTDAKVVKEGLDIIHNKFAKTLESKGLKPMRDLKGADFDTELHEAITQIPAPEESLKGKIVDVVEQGYWLEDKVIRFAKVVIGN